MQSPGLKVTNYFNPQRRRVSGADNDNVSALGADGSWRSRSTSEASSDGSVTAARKGAFQQRRMKSLSTPNKKHNLQVRYARTSVCCRQSRTARSIRWREMVDKHKHDNVSLRRRPSAITLQHLRYVVAAADRGSFRQAAEAPGRGSPLGCQRVRSRFQLGHNLSMMRIILKA